MLVDVTIHHGDNRRLETATALPSRPWLALEGTRDNTASLEANEKDSTDNTSHDETTVPTPTKSISLLRRIDGLRKIQLHIPTYHYYNPSPTCIASEIGRAAY
jgi:hypothetical protein